MWTVASAKWSVGLRSLLRLTDWAVSFRVCAVLESAREQAGAARAHNSLRSPNRPVQRPPALGLVA